MKAHFLVNGKLVLKETTTSIGSLPYYGFGPCPKKTSVREFFVMAEKLCEEERVARKVKSKRVKAR